MRTRLTVLVWILFFFVGPQLVFAAPKEKEKDKEAEHQPMDVLTFISKLVEACAWPLVVLVIFHYYKDEFETLLKRITKFEGPGGIKSEFQRDLKEAEKKADEANLPTVPVITAPTTTTTTTTQPPGPPSSPPEEQVYDYLIRHSPREAIARAWSEVEKAVTEAFSVPEGSLFPDMRVVRRIAMPSELGKLYGQLRAMRNRAVHELEKPITPLAAEEYVQLAKRFLAAIPEAKRKWNPPVP